MKRMSRESGGGDGCDQYEEGGKEVMEGEDEKEEERCTRRFR
jgi:hypothetical protein